MEVDHIGYAVKKIGQAKDVFETLGFKFEEIIRDDDRNIYIQFGMNGGYRIELVSPVDKGKESPVDLILSKNGPTAYHLCYKTDDIQSDIDALLERHFILTKAPAPAKAFAGKRVAFLYNAKIGLIELAES